MTSARKMGRISKMGRLLPYLKRLWATDIALTTLLIFLLIYIFLLFPTGQIGSVRVLANLFFSLILITGAIAATRNRVFRLLVLSWGLLAFVFLWVRHLFPHQALIFLTTCLSLLPGVTRPSHFGSGLSRRAHHFPSYYGRCSCLSAARAHMVPGLLPGRAPHT